MPFAGDASAAWPALDALRALAVGPGDELILADNSGAAGVDDAGPAVRVVRATGEASPAHARNVGAAHASRDWILFLDADCRAPAGLLDAFFAEPVADDVGALAGEVVPAPPAAGSLAERYGAARSFLGQRAHLAHPYLPRAVAANLLVRRTAFEQLGGFYEGVRAAEDTDFSWRLQRAGWRLELRAGAAVEHQYRATVGELRRQWRGYAAGRAWLARRYPDFRPEPAVARGLHRALRPRRNWTVQYRSGPEALPYPQSQSQLPLQPPSRSRELNRPVQRRERAEFLALDLLLAGEELAGFALSNRPAAATDVAAELVFVADEYPAPGAALPSTARVEAARRPERIPPGPAARVTYLEDEGLASRAAALVSLLARHPGRCLADRAAGGPSLLSLAPAVRRLERAPRALVRPQPGAENVAARLKALAGAR
jgi:GT2 family glycosyltransferase